MLRGRPTGYEPLSGGEELPVRAPGSGNDQNAGLRSRIASGAAAAAGGITRSIAQGGKGPQAIPQATRQRDKFVPLPNALITAEASEESENDAAGESQHQWPSEWSRDGALEQAAGKTASDAARQIMPAGIPVPQTGSGGGGGAEPNRRITVFCFAESLDRKQLEVLLLMSHRPGAITSFEDVVHLALDGGTTGASAQAADVFFFDFGVIIMFGLSEAQEKDMMERVATKVQRKPYSAAEVEIDEFQFVYSATEPPHIKNDRFTINKRQANNTQVRLAIAHALAQSSKLSVFEERVWDLVEETRDIPEALALHGTVPMSTKRVAQLIGKVFLQNANVNLLSSVLDTPAFFWSAPDHLQALYERACEYLELEARVEVLNARFQVLQEMLDIVRSQQNNVHAARLELIIIWLLIVDCVLMLFQLLSLFGFIGRHE